MSRHILLPLLLAASVACTSEPTSSQRTFATPDDAVRALTDGANREDLSEVSAIFGPDAQSLIDTSDPATARRNRQLFAVAIAEQWRLVDEGALRKVLVVGHEEWPFPVPLVKEGSVWRFDTAAGKEEVVARRIGRNELAALRICAFYVTAQREYAAQGRDGKRAGVYAQQLRSDEGRHNGLYWPTARGERRSPLGAFIADADVAGHSAKSGDGPVPFRGYYFRILTGQGPAAPGGEKSYVVNGDMSQGFALVAWPAYYDESGVMTFIVNQDGRVFEQDFGAETEAAAREIKVFDPSDAWTAVQP
jgi:hypothetical protein